MWCGTYEKHLKTAFFGLFGLDVGPTPGRTPRTIQGHIQIGLEAVGVGLGIGVTVYIRMYVYPRPSLY